MLRTTAIAVTLAGALALGTASATSLGSFSDLSFAASDVDLDVCAVATGTELLDLLPAIPAVGDVVPADDTGLDPQTAGSVLPADGGTLLLESLDLTALVADLPATCTGDLADLVLIGAGEVVAVVEAIDLTAAVTDISVTDVVDIATVDTIRLVVRSDAATS